MRPFLSDEMQPIREPRVGCRSFGFGEVRGINEARREVTAILSTPTIDRYGEVILPESVMKRLDGFKKNPVLLANHVHSADDGSSGIIGKWVEIGIRKLPGVGKAVVGTCRLMEDDPLAESWWQRFRQGVAVAFSIGFIVHGWEMRDIKHEGQTRRVRVFTDIELIEVSAVSVPACEDAVILAASLGAGGRGVPASMMEPDTGIHGPAGGANGLSRRRMNKQLSLSIGPLIRGEVSRALNTDPGSELCVLIQNIVELTVGSMRHPVLAPSSQKSSRATRAPSKPDDGLDDLLDGQTASAGKPGGAGTLSEGSFADGYFDEGLARRFSEV